MLSPHTSYRWRGERDIEPIKCMLSPHTSYRWRGERDIELGDNQVCTHHTPATGGEEREIKTIQGYALTTHQLQVERRESHRDNQVYALTTHQLQVERGERVHRANQVSALTTHQLQVERRERHRANQVSALTTHQLQVERRERHKPIKCMLSPHTSYRWREREES